MPKHFIIDYLKYLKNRWRELNLVNLAAQLSYRFLLAFIPLLMLLYNLINRFAHELSGEFLTLLRSSSLNFLDTFIYTATSGADATKSSLYLSVAFIFFIVFACLSAVHALMVTLDKVFKPVEPQDVFLSWPFALLYLLVGSAFVITALATYLGLLHLADGLFFACRFSYAYLLLKKIGGKLFIGGFVLLLLTLIYMHLPTKKLSFRRALPGGLAGTAAFACIYGLYRLLLLLNLNLQGLLLFFSGILSLIFFLYLLSFIIVFGTTMIVFIKEGTLGEP